MNAYELAGYLEKQYIHSQGVADAISMLRQQADRIAELEKKLQESAMNYISICSQADEHYDMVQAYKQVLQSIANEQVELSHDKIKWQCEDHIRWAKEALK